MIHNTRNRSNDTTESQKKNLFKCSFSVQSVKNDIYISILVCFNIKKFFNQNVLPSLAPYENHME